MDPRDVLVAVLAEQAVVLFKQGLAEPAHRPQWDAQVVRDRVAERFQAVVHPLEFSCQWPVYGIGETRISIDGQLILDAARRSVQLWPEDGPDAAV